MLSPSAPRADPGTAGPVMLSAFPVKVPTKEQEGHLQSELGSLPSLIEAPAVQNSLQETWVAPSRRCPEVGCWLPFINQIRGYGLSEPEGTSELLESSALPSRRMALDMWLPA